MRLTVRQLEKPDVYKDLVRVPERHRKDGTGRPIRESSICKVTVEGRSTLVSARGLAGETAEIIRMDDKTRLDLGVTDGSEHDFTLERVWWPNQFRWAWNSSDPAPAIAARIGLVSLSLGVLSLVLSMCC